MVSYINELLHYAGFTREANKKTNLKKNPNGKEKCVIFHLVPGEVAFGCTHFLWIEDFIEEKWIWLWIV